MERQRPFRHIDLADEVVASFRTQPYAVPTREESPKPQPARLGIRPSARLVVEEDLRAGRVRGDVEGRRRPPPRCRWRRNRAVWPTHASGRGGGCGPGRIGWCRRDDDAHGSQGRGRRRRDDGARDGRGHRERGGRRRRLRSLRVEGRLNPGFERPSLLHRLDAETRRNLELLPRILVRLDAEVGFSEPEMGEVPRLEVGPVGRDAQSGHGTLLGGTAQQVDRLARLAIPQCRNAIRVELVPLLGRRRAGCQASEHHQPDDEPGPATQAAPGNGGLPSWTTLDSGPVCVIVR